MARPLAGHGTDNRYKCGCRCEDCTVAHCAYTAAQRAELLASGRLTHGIRAGYDTGCRCDKCITARRAAYPRENEARRNRAS